MMPIYGKRLIWVCNFQGRRSILEVFTAQPMNDTEFALWKAEVNQSMGCTSFFTSKVEDRKRLSSLSTGISQEVLPWMLCCAQATAVAELYLQLSIFVNFWIIISYEVMQETYKSRLLQFNILPALELNGWPTSSTLDGLRCAEELSQAYRWHLESEPLVYAKRKWH